MRRLNILLLVLAWPGCETVPPPEPDASAHVTRDLGEPPSDIASPYGFDGNYLPVPDHSGTIVFSITDADTKAVVPARVIFRKPPGSGFADSLTMPLSISGPTPGSNTGATVSPGVVGAPEGVMLQSGWGEVRVPPGDYRLFITRGAEYEAVELEVKVTEGDTQAVNAELVRSVDTTGWLGADMHIHTGRSFDSKLPVDRRVISMLTNGIEILVSTDHHGAYDFREILPQLGYGGDLAGSVAGDELNFKEGHAGVYPVATNPNLPAGGSPPYQNLNAQGMCDAPVVGTNCLTAADAFPVMRALRPGGSLVTVNHPWWGTADLGYFTNIAWGAGTGASFPVPLSTADDFDALEIVNGYWTRTDAESYLLADWFYLLSTGHRITALGNSDTHRLEFVRAGWPRTWLRLPIDHPGDITDDLLADAIRNQRAIASTGPFVTLEVDGGQIGDVVRPAHPDSVSVHIVADAPDWMSLDEVLLFVNGVRRRDYTITDHVRPRFTIDSTESIGGDSFLVVLAFGHTGMPGDVVGEQGQSNGMATIPWAVTNPIYIDANRDGNLTLTPITDSTLPWIPPTTVGPPPMRPPPGTGSSHPPGAECEPPVKGKQIEPALDAQSNLLHLAAPLLYP